MSSESRFVKWVMFFERNCIMKWAIFFASFCWLWDLRLENVKPKRNSEGFLWYIWTNTRKLYARNNIFKKRISNMTFWIIYILVQISVLGTALGRFSQFFLFFFNFSSLTNHGDRHFYTAPLHKKTFCGPVYRAFFVRFFFWCTNADLKISLHVLVHIKILPWKFRFLNPKNSRVI